MLFQVRAKTRNIGDIERQECEAARRQERRAIQTSGEEIIKCEGHMNAISYLILIVSRG